MDIVHKALTLIVIFAVLVFFHELGHFLLAKIFRMRVEEFALGMGLPKLRLFSDGETEYTLRAIPLGGFVRIAGMEIEDAYEQRITGADRRYAEAESELTDTNTGVTKVEVEEAPPPDPNGFNGRPIYQRFLVILAGPVFSFLLGWLALCLVGVLFGVPEKSTLAVKVVTPDGIAAKAGLKPGDTFLAVDGKPIDSFDGILDRIHSSAGKPLRITIRSDEGATRDLTVTPKLSDLDGEPKPVGLINIQPQPVVLSTKRLGLADSFASGNVQVASWFVTVAHLFATGGFRNTVGGPIEIARQTGEAVDIGGGTPMSLLGQFSLSLGLFNLFPIPILDGGHLALLTLEAIRKRKLTAAQTQRVFATGLAIIGLLFVYVMFKDLFRRS